MQYREYGTDRGKTIMLLHGGGLSWWNYRDVAELLKPDYHVILPILDGHAGSDRPFTTIEDNADEIIAFIRTHLGGHVAMIGGLSLGGQILLSILSRRRGICRYAIVESASVIPSRSVHALIGPAVACSYGLIRHRSFAKWQFASLHMNQDLFEDYVRDTCRIRKDDMIAFLRASTAYALDTSVTDTDAKVYVFAGGKEGCRILRSADRICEAVPGCVKTILPGLYHGEFSINHPSEYVRTVSDIME